jgi:hypothetical protein
MTKQTTLLAAGFILVAGLTFSGCSLSNKQTDQVASNAPAMAIDSKEKDAKVAVNPAVGTAPVTPSTSDADLLEAMAKLESELGATAPLSTDLQDVE